MWFTKQQRYNTHVRKLESEATSASLIIAVAGYIKQGRSVVEPVDVLLSEVDKLHADLQDILTEFEMASLSMQDEQARTGTLDGLAQAYGLKTQALHSLLRSVGLHRLQVAQRLPDIKWRLAKVQSYGAEMQNEAAKYAQTAAELAIADGDAVIVRHDAILAKQATSWSSLTDAKVRDDFEARFVKRYGSARRSVGSSSSAMYGGAWGAAMAGGAAAGGGCAASSGGGFC